VLADFVGEFSEAALSCSRVEVHGEADAAVAEEALGFFRVGS